jgi:putative phosphoribosyl transferase
LIGEFDRQVIALNEQAYEKLPGIKSLRIIKGASHLFEEPGTLEEVALYSAEWFVQHLGNRKTQPFRDNIFV